MEHQAVVKLISIFIVHIDAKSYVNHILRISAHGPINFKFMPMAATQSLYVAYFDLGAIGGAFSSTSLCRHGIARKVRQDRYFGSTGF
jgi:hypothetical protein